MSPNTTEWPCGRKNGGGTVAVTSVICGMRGEIRDPLTHEIIGAAIEVHRAFGHGLLESAYEKCLCFELAERGLLVKRHPSLPLVYKKQRIDAGFRPDLIVNDSVLIELKCVEQLLKVHDASCLPICD